MAMPASSIPMGPIMLPMLLTVFCSISGRVRCRKYSSIPARMARMFTFSSSFFHSKEKLPCRQALPWVQMSTVCTMMNAQE